MSVVVEVSSPSKRKAFEVTLLSLAVKTLLRLTTLQRTLWILDHFPRKPWPKSETIEIPTEDFFGRAGACLGRQVARTQYLRFRRTTSSILIGVAPPGEQLIDAHAWLSLDEHAEYAVIHQIVR